MEEERKIRPGDVVKHFKHELVDRDSAEYIYRVLAIAYHSETQEKLVVYRAFQPPHKVCARPYDMFMSEVDHKKYPNIRQKYRFEVCGEAWWD